MKMIFDSAIAMIREHPLRGFLSLFALFAGSFLMGSAWNVADSIDRLVQTAWGVQGTALVLANGTISADGRYERKMPPEFDAKTAELVAAALPGAGAVSPVTSVPFSRIEYAGKQYQIRRMLGVGEAYLDTMGLKLVAGRSFTEAEIKQRQALIVLSEEVAVGLFGSAEAALGKSFQTVMAGPGNGINIRGSQGGNQGGNQRNAAPAGANLRGFRMPSQSFTVSGVYATPDETTRRRLGLGDAIIPYNASLPGNFQVPEGFFWGTVVFKANGVSVEAARVALNQAFMAEKGDAVQVAVWQGNPNNPSLNNQNTAQSLEALAKLVRALGLVLALVAGVGMYGIMTVEVAGRSKHYGIRRALGASAPAIVRLVAAQATGIAALGASVGLVLAGLLSGPLIQGLSPWLELVGLRTSLLAGIGFNPLPLILALALILAFSALFGLLPALRVLKTSPVALLREDAS